MYSATLLGTVADSNAEKKSNALNFLRQLAPFFPPTYLMFPGILKGQNDKKEIIVSTAVGDFRIQKQRYHNHIETGDAVKLLGTCEEGVTTYNDVIKL